MTASESRKRHSYKIFQRKSIFHWKSKHRLKRHSYYSEDILLKRSRIRHFFKTLHQTYRSLWFTATLFFRFLCFIDKITRDIFIFIEKIVQIIRIVHGWICMLRAIFSALHLIVSRIMILSACIHRIFYLLSILFEPVYNGTLEKSVRSFSNFVFYYYSSNGACYTLHARTRHIVGKVRQRWKRNYIYLNNDDDDDDIYYDAFNEECELFKIIY